MKTVLSLLGSYAGTADFFTFIQRRDEGGPREDIAAMAGKYFIAAQESREGATLAESVIKGLTGGDVIRARRLHENGFEFKPTHKIWLATNHKPTIRGTDVGIWSRVRLIPFTVSFEGRENKHLKDALQHELPGILNWVLEGCANWRLHGLNVPRSVSEANDEYRSECDQLKRFLDERCIIGDYCTVGAHDLYLEYKRWANETGEEVPSEVKFADRMRERGFKKERTMARLLYLNVGLTLHKTGPISDAD